MIIVNTKVLIIRDKIFNRSIFNKRDSELSLLIKENKYFNNEKTGKNFIMDGKIYKGANFAISFRKSLMAEHLGLNEDDPILEDPVDNKLFSFITSRANSNTIIYRNLFRCYPDDTFTNFEILNQAQKLQESISKSTLLQNYLKSKDKIIGHIVEFPLNFLKEEELGRIFFTKENLVPEHNFT